MCVKCGKQMSEYFNVTNGVRQDSVLSPGLFNLYIDVISKELNKPEIGCCTDGRIVNNLICR